MVFLNRVELDPIFFFKRNINEIEFSTSDSSLKYFQQFVNPCRFYSKFISGDNFQTSDTSLLVINNGPVKY